MTRERERELIDTVLGGCADAFGELVLDNQKKVYNHALRMVRNEEDALDISQEAFINAFRHLRAFKGDCAFSVWLYRITSNLCIDFLRKAKKRRETPITYLSDDGCEQDIEIPDVRYSPETEFERAQLRKAIEEGISQLPDNMREIIVLREINGLSYSDIAQILNIEEGTVKSRISRARVRLAKTLVQGGNFFAKTASRESEGR